MVRRLLLAMLLSVFLLSVAIPAMAAGDITLNWWIVSYDSDSQAEFTKGIIKEFEFANPGIKVNPVTIPWDGMHTKLLAGLKSATPPDVLNIAVAWNPQYAAADLLYNLDGFIKDIDVEDFYKGPWNTGVYRGSCYGIPHRTETMVMFYNKTMFKEAGLNPNKPPKTWQELLEYSRKLTKGNQYGFGMVGTEKEETVSRALPCIWAFGGDILTPDNAKAVINEPAAVEGLQFYVDLFTKHKVCPPGSVANNARDVERLFENGKVAIMFTGHYVIPSIKKNAPDLDYGVATVPGFKDRGTVLGGWNTVISAKTKHPKEAWQFVKFFTSPEHIAIFTSTFPPRRSVAACGRFQDPIQQVGVEALEYARPAPTTPLWPAMQEVLHKAIQQALLSQKSVRESLDWAAEQIDDIIKRG